MNLPSVDNVSLLLVIAGPAGSGKSTLCERMAVENESVERVVTCTTRPPRPGEIDGKDYHFLSDAQFDRYLKEDAFIEWARVHANRYGSLKAHVQAKLEQAIDLVMNVDVQGVANFQKAALENPVIGKRLVTVFVTPSSMDELKGRLIGRNQDAMDEIERRMITARKEISHWNEFDYFIDSTTKEVDFEAVLNIWKAEKRRVRRLID